MPIDTKQYGKTVIDFVNARTSDDACIVSMENIKKRYKLEAAFKDKITFKFPRIDTYVQLLENEKEIIEAFLDIKELEKNLYYLDGVFLNFVSYNIETNELILREYEGPREEQNFSEPFKTTPQDLIGDIREQAIDEVIEILDQLPIARIRYLTLKNSYQNGNVDDLIGKSGDYREIVRFDESVKLEVNRFRNILQMIIANKPYNEISEIRSAVESYNSFPKTRAYIDMTNGMMKEIPTIYVDRFFGLSTREHFFKCIIQDVSYSLIKFLFADGNNRNLFRKCEQCSNFFIAKTIREQKYCSDKCRLAFHNRKRIESGEHARYKRERKEKGLATIGYFS